MTYRLHAFYQYPPRIILHTVIEVKRSMSDRSAANDSNHFTHKSWFTVNAVMTRVPPLCSDD